MLLKGCSTVAVILCCVGLSTTAQAGDLRHLDEVAIALRGDAARAANEIRYHFRGSRHYDHLYRDAYEMYVLADHIHELVHQHDLDHIRADLTQLDSMFHHFEDLVGKVNVEYSSRPVYGHGYGYGHGYHFGGGRYFLDRLNRLVSSMSDNLHHLQEDVDSVLGPQPLPSQPLPPAAPVLKGPGTVHFNLGGKGIGVSLRIR